MLIYIYPNADIGTSVLMVSSILYQVIIRLVVRWRKGDFITWLYVAGYSTQSEE